MSRTFFRQGKTGTDLYTFRTEGKSSQYSITGTYSSGGYQRERGSPAHGRDQAERRRLFASVMPSGFKAFGNNGIDTCLFTFDGKQGAAYHMDDCHTMFFQERSPFLRTSGRGEDYFYFFFHQNIHQALYFRVHQRNVHSERFVGSRFTFADMFAQHVGMHRTGAEQSQSPGIADSRSQSPTAAPNHPTLYNGVFYTE